jgi:hypothetical protein
MTAWRRDSIGGFVCCRVKWAIQRLLHRSRSRVEGDERTNTHARRRCPFLERRAISLMRHPLPATAAHPPHVDKPVTARADTGIDPSQPSLALDNPAVSLDYGIRLHRPCRQGVHQGVQESSPEQAASYGQRRSGSRISVRSYHQSIPGVLAELQHVTSPRFKGKRLWSSIALNQRRVIRQA